MALAQTDRMAMRYIREDSFGVPASGPLSTLLITSEDLTTNFTTTQSESVIGDRQVFELVRTGQTAQGSINFELIYGNIDQLLAGALANDWSTDTLENGNDLISFAFEKNFQDIGLIYAFLGCRIGGFSMNFPLTEKITGSVNVLGKAGILPSGSIGTGQPGALPNNPPMVTLDKLQIEEGGSGIVTATGFSFQVNNNLREQRALGTSDLIDLSLGTFEVTGTVEAYLEDRRFLDLLINDSPSDFEIVTEDSLGNEYTWIFPRFKFTSVTGPANTGRSADVMQTLNWTAMRDPGTGITMAVERKAA